MRNGTKQIPDEIITNTTKLMMRGAIIEVGSAMENRYRRKTVWDVPTFYITHYIGCRFEHADLSMQKRYLLKKYRFISKQFPI
jgi:hypothetical protein